MEAAVTQRSRRCMQTVTPAKSPPTRAGGGWTTPGVPGAPQGPVPWSRRCAAVARAVSPPAGVESRRRRLAAKADLGLERVLLCVAEVR